MFHTPKNMFLDRKKNSQVSVSALFFVSIVFGILLKLIFSHFWTIGYDDYHLTSMNEKISLIGLQKKALDAGGSLAYTPRKTSGLFCTDSK